MGRVRKKQFEFVDHHTDLKITDLIDKATLQAIQDQFTDEYDVGNGLLNANANPITFERGHCKYCKAVRKKESGRELCRRSDEVLINSIKRYKKAFWHICEGGLLDFGAPIFIEDKIVAFFLWGQIRCDCRESGKNGISVILRENGFGKASDGKCKAIASTLQRDYFGIPGKTNDKISSIAIAGLRFTERLKGILTKLVQWEKPLEVQDFVSKMVQTEDLNSLFDLCVFEIPKLLETEHCSIFKVVKIENDKPRLVLQRTSYKKSKDKEGRAYYLEGQGLTGWVWKNRCALRLNDLNNKWELAEHPGLKWSHTVDDSDLHKEWLGVPLFGRKKDVIGVIRVPVKKDNRLGGGFDFKDEMRLMLICKHVAGEIELLEAKKRIIIAQRVGEHFAVNLSKAKDPAAVAQSAVDVAKKIFGEDGKAYFFNMLSKGDGKLRVQGIAGSLTNTAMRKKEVPPNTLLGKFVKESQPIIIHDIPAVKKRGEFFDLARGVECAMSAPVSSGDTMFGVLSVGANRRFEFVEEPDLNILKDIASIAGAALERLVAEESSKEYFNLIQNLPVGVYRATVIGDGSFEMANQAMADMFGYKSVEELREIHVSEIYDDPLKRKQQSDELKEKKLFTKKETYFKKKNQDRFWGAVTARAVPETGEVQYFDGIIEDITAFKNLHAAVAAADELLKCPDLDSLYRRAVELAREKLKVERCGLHIKIGDEWHGTYGTDVDGRTTIENSISIKGDKYIVAFLKEIEQGLPHWKEFPSRMLTNWNSIQKKNENLWEAWNVMTAVRMPPSQNIEGIFFNDTAISGKPIDPAQQEILAVYCSMLGSLIAIKRTEEETSVIVMKAKLDTWRALTSRSYHSIGNQIASIRGQIRNLEDEDISTESRRRLLEINSCLDRIHRFNSEYGRFSNKKPYNPTETDVGQLLGNVVKQFRDTNPDVTVEFQVASGIPRCQCDQSLLHDAITELLVNSTHYIPAAKGTIKVSADTTTDFPSGRAVRIVVSDNGPGVSLENKRKIFEPFVTFSPETTGLGLAIVQSAVLQHNGEIKEIGEPGKGAVFEIKIPFLKSKRSIL